jgi:hypothetical protein
MAGPNVPAWSLRPISAADFEWAFALHGIGKAFSLHVLKTSPRAVALYERAGLRNVGIGAVKPLMRSVP